MSASFRAREYTVKTRHVKSRTIDIRPRPALMAAAALYLALLSGAGCGVEPEAGLEGELCVYDDDCSTGLVCERRVCLSLASSDYVERDSEFFYGLVFTQYTGDGDDNLKRFGDFISDLSSAYYPYFVMEAPFAGELEFGKSTAVQGNVPNPPVQIDPLNTVSQLQYGVGAEFSTEVGTIALPLLFQDATTQISFDLRLIQGRIVWQEFGDEISGELSGVLRAVDAENLTLVLDGSTVTLFEIIRGEDLTVDTDGDRIPDAWRLSWQFAGNRE
ncbi:MAG: hypothetical protein KC561_16930 [Myxococcales bacterium]|nr:hypothetical protein [Myxococcales bacterium]